MNKISKQYIIVGVIVVALIAAAIFIMTGSGKRNEQADGKDTVFDKPTNVIPTVDSSVLAELEGDKEATLTISGIPAETEEIEYEFSYNTKAGSIEGVIGSITVEQGEDSVEEEITFGTCSSGVCRYHELDGSVKGIFKFSGGYGQRLLEKEFSL